MSEQKKYKSPVAKLVKFFEKSRDNWKVKYQTSKTENKQLKNRIHALENSKKKWKTETIELRHQIKQAEKCNNSTEDDKKNTRNSA